MGLGLGLRLGSGVRVRVGVRARGRANLALLRVVRAWRALPQAARRRREQRRREVRRVNGQEARTPHGHDRATLRGPTRGVDGVDTLRVLYEALVVGDGAARAHGANGDVVGAVVVDVRA